MTALVQSESGREWTGPLDSNESYLSGDSDPVGKSNTVRREIHWVVESED